MARLNPPGYLRLVQTQQLEITYAGGEANVAVSLANFGKNAVFVTRLPDNDLTKAAMRRLRGFGVDISPNCHRRRPHGNILCRKRSISKSL